MTAVDHKVTRREFTLDDGGLAVGALLEDALDRGDFETYRALWRCVVDRCGLPLPDVVLGGPADELSTAIRAAVDASYRFFAAIRAVEASVAGTAASREGITRTEGRE
jgi:hypothetical protein